MDKIEELREIIKHSDNIVFFGGAGVSTESHIPDFRSDNGLYKRKYPYPAEQMLSHTFYTRHPKEFFEFYFNEMIYEDALPNKAHHALAELEKEGKLKAVITQNIDGLHQKAGSVNVLELHGSVLRNFCTKCGKPFTLEQTIALRDEHVIYKAVDAISHADVLIVGGTSLVVYPAAGLIQYFRGKHLVLINKQSTPMDSQADLVIHEAIGKVLDEVIQ